MSQDWQKIGKRWSCSTLSITPLGRPRNAYGSEKIKWQYEECYTCFNVCPRLPQVRPRSASRFRQDRVAVHLYFLRCVSQGAAGKAKECLMVQAG